MASSRMIGTKIKQTVEKKRKKMAETAAFRFSEASLFASPQHLPLRFTLFHLNHSIRHFANQRTSHIRFIKASSLRGKAMAAETVRVRVPTSVPVRVAHELLLAGHRYLDVRTPEEFSAGHASGAINVPYMFRVASGMSKNPNFVQQVSSHFRKYDEIIVGCQSGKRSLMATADLLAAGFTGVTDIAGGYDAWKQNELPTEQ